MIDTRILWKNDFVELRETADGRSGIAIATSNYIPIESFKEAFEKAENLAQDKEWNAFIFDKSNLDTFHQPSMEWYYTEWKKALSASGLHKHFKILPNIPWFKTSVEAGISEIKANYPDFDFSTFTVEYVEDLGSAIEATRA